MPMYIHAMVPNYLSPVLSNFVQIKKQPQFQFAHMVPILSNFVQIKKIFEVTIHKITRIHLRFEDLEFRSLYKICPIHKHEKVQVWNP